MATTAPNMGLKVWNLLTDPYDHSQLADNWAKVDQHDHSTGKGVQVPTGGIAEGAISSSKIGNEQVSPEKLTVSATESVGINTPSRTYRKNIFLEETYSNSTTSYTLVDSATVYVPANGRLMITYIALHKATTANASIQMFLDEVEVKQLVAGGAPTAATAVTSEVSSFFGPLLSISGSSAVLNAIKGVTADTSFVTTGLYTSGGTVTLFNMPAGNHKVEIKAKAGTSGKIEIKNRYLFVRSEGYS